MRATATRLIESSSAQLRIDAARGFVETHARDGDVWLVGASRIGGRSRAVDRDRDGRHHRHPPLQPHPARRPARRAGSRGSGPGPGHLPRLGSRRGARDFRGTTRRRVAILRASRKDPGVPARVGAHAAGTADGRGRRGPAWPAAARRSRPRRLAPAFRRTVRKRECDRSRYALRRGDRGAANSSDLRHGYGGQAGFQPAPSFRLPASSWSAAAGCPDRLRGGVRIRQGASRVPASRLGSW